MLLAEIPLSLEQYAASMAIVAVVLIIIAGVLKFAIDVLARYEKPATQEQLNRTSEAIRNELKMEIEKMEDRLSDHKRNCQGLKNIELRMDKHEKDVKEDIKELKASMDVGFNNINNNIDSVRKVVIEHLANNAKGGNKDG